MFIDEAVDADYALRQSAFEPVWQVLKALRAHDQRLADELDSLRTSIGRQRGGHISLPDNVILDVPSLVLRDFEQSFYVRAVQASTEKAPLTLDRILIWVDEYKSRTGDWPSQTSGAIPDTEETWAGISHALDRGHRGLNTTGYTLAQLLEDYRGVRNRKNLGSLTEQTVLKSADEYFRRHGTWPNGQSGHVEGTSDTWAGISVALRNGARGLPRRISLADLLWEKRGVPNKANRPRLSIKQILRWIDDHKSRTGDWPDQTSGTVHGTSETWRGINSALSKGLRGLGAGSSIMRLLVEHRSVKTRFWDETVEIADILGWCDSFFGQHARWPKSTDGAIPGTPYTWLTVDSKLRAGWTRCRRRSSLPRLLHEKRGYRHRHMLPPLTREKILRFAKQHYRREGRWPTSTSGEIPGSDETWAGINAALSQGQRGFPRGDSLPRFLNRELGVVHRLATERLSIKRILRWADEHKARYGSFPTIHEKRPPAPRESWMAINAALERGARGLPGGTSLPKLLAKERGVTRGIHRPRLKVATIVRWAREHHSATGAWPTEGSGEIAGTDERWNNIAQCVRLGLRGRPLGWTLKKIVDRYCRK